MASKLKQHSSQFLLTVNSNSTDVKYKSKLLNAFEEYYANFENFLTSTDPDLVDEIRAPTVACEIGPTYHRVHLHAFIPVRHRTRCQINLIKTRPFFNKMVGTNCYINVKYIPDQAVNVENYIMKSFREHEEKKSK